MSTYYNLTLSTRSSTWLNLLIEWSGNFFNPTLRWRGLSKYLGNARSLFIEIEPTLTDSVLKNIFILFFYIVGNINLLSIFKWRSILKSSLNFNRLPFNNSLSVGLISKIGNDLSSFSIFLYLISDLLYLGLILSIWLVIC